MSSQNGGKKEKMNIQIFIGLQYLGELCQLDTSIIDNKSNYDCSGAQPFLLVDVFYMASISW